MIQFSKTALKTMALSALLTIMPIHNAYAAPGVLPNAPLFLSSTVEPNVFFTLDDSLSMEFVVMADAISGGYVTIGGSPVMGGVNFIGVLTFYHPTWTENGKNIFFITMPPSTNVDPVNFPEWNDTWIWRTHQGNSIYYNPNQVYKPWPGVKADGVTPMYTDADETQVWQDPNKTNPATDNFVDLTATLDYSYTNPYTSTTYTYPASLYLPSYYVWADDGDGVLEPTDGKTLVTIPAGSAEMQNFANWFQYYRSRMHTTKAAIGATINGADFTRMGLDVYNTGHRKNLESMTDATNQRLLLTEFYNTVENGSTPARTALDRVGKYFESTTTPTAILPAADGGECQQNFNIMLTDGFWNGSAASPAVANADADDASNPFDGGTYADTYSDTLADVAMHYYKRDLRGDLADKVPTQDGVDEADHQHLVNYGVGLGVIGTLPEGTDPSTGIVWPEPVTDTSTTVDDLWHATYNSRGEYLSAQTADELQDSLTAAIRNISARTATAAAVAVNSAQLNTESVVYLAQFNSDRWIGELLALKILDPDTGELQDESSAKWKASTYLNNPLFDPDTRTVITNHSSPPENDGVAFRWDDISSDMQSDLRINPAGGTDSTTVGEARLDFIRGDSTNEGSGTATNFRERISKLGDMVNSGPVFVGAPTLNWPDFAPFPTGSDAYSTFKTDASVVDRQKMVYVGANDGMLHAFNDDNGVEEFAYVPEMLLSTASGEGLHYLSDPGYNHKFYVDQTPTISDVFITSGGSQEWHTVLVGAMRGGARGIFGLDITNPSLFQEANADKMVLWEFTSNDDADLGYTYSRPAIAYTNAGTWVAIFGNGYNDLGTGEASLFIVEIEGGVDGTWQAADYKKITTGVGTAGDRNGLAAPALADIDGNGTVDRVYAGDLKGNLWVFDLESTNAGSWAVAYKSGSTPTPLFTAVDSTVISPAPAIQQQITAKPVLARHPTQPDSNSNAPNIMVYFGTGQYLVDSDNMNTEKQAFYGVWDAGDKALDYADLIEQTFDGSFTVPVLTRNPVDYSTDHGWYFLLPDSGERAVTSPIARADTVFFNTFVPVDDPCQVGGYGYKYAVDMTTGGSPLEPTFDANGDGVIDENDTVSNGSSDSTLVAVKQEGFLPEPVFIEDLAFTGKEATNVKALKDIPVGRFSWQELIQ
ncbi:MAG: type IV pilus assembly protein PilY1 [Planctomycetota bacterium]|jgi:type IV pilus assembly protein PilY1